ncbi:CerR family C-terminal domain-containing protein [Aurantiacibacter sp. D1-12]|uniref:CerR family C-terminal domain-containing protein n=1 Tax=Aurantiacibacter sp. D1-12 TaxID=2993658 RepID=UPI00237C6A8B|nr:CerR family C-terminal domain-containing protein [Aurantiacibacter sp. D1-12]MDE1467763.1 CerR family C-terminal domain-containing protein [Aurantiacibacter sp. D1-12]
MRERLISVAIRQFGERGFDGASTRDIAAEAETTMSNITYHFGGKEGLYRAAAEAIVMRFASVTADLFRDHQDEGTEPDAARRIEIVGTVLRTIGAFMLSDEAAPFARFVAREQQNPASVMREFFEREIKPKVRMLEEQVKHLRPDLNDQEVSATVFYLLSMAISLRSSRLSLCMFMDVPDIEEPLGSQMLDRLDHIVRELLEVKP